MSAILQNSSLRKNLIFIAHGDEWNGWRDKVSGVNPTVTAAYPVLDQAGRGRRWLEPLTASPYSSHSAIVAFGTRAFSVIRKVKINTLGAIQTLTGGVANSFELYISASGYLTALKNGGSPLTASTSLLVAGGEYKLAYVRSGTTGTYYVNDAVAGTCTDASDYTVGCTLRGNGTGYFLGLDYMSRIFNYACTADEVIYNSKPENPIKRIDRGATGVNIMAAFNLTNWETNGTIDNATTFHGTDFWVRKSGIIVAGKKFLLSGNGTGTPDKAAAFYNYGVATSFGGSFYISTPGGIWTKPPTIATSADTGISLACTTTATISIAALSLVQLGCVLDLNAEGLSSGTWVDKTTSAGTATNSGTAYILPAASNLGASYFNGASKIAYTGMNGLTGDLTFATEITPLTLAGRLFDNSKFLVYVNPSGYLTVSRDGTTLINSGSGSIAINTTYKVLITSTSAGVTNIYINGVLSGTANQAAGTPTSGTSWNFGNNAASNQAHTGRMKAIQIIGRIVTADEIGLLNAIN